MLRKKLLNSWGQNESALTKKKKEKNLNYELEWRQSIKQKTKNKVKDGFPEGEDKSELGGGGA